MAIVDPTIDNSGRKIDKRIDWIDYGEFEGNDKIGCWQ